MLTDFPFPIVMITGEIIVLTLIGMLVWLWLDSASARETGTKAVQKACMEESLQLLDETISLSKIKLARNHDGRLTLHRCYDFEYSDTGDNRRRGRVQLLGHSVTLLYLGPRTVQ